MRRHDVRKLVLASTSSLYAGQRMPFDETLAVNTPISPYAASKKAAEVLCYSYHYLYRIDVSVLPCACAGHRRQDTSTERQSCRMLPPRSAKLSATKEEEGPHDPSFRRRS